jgi:hypothetical protein
MKTFADYLPTLTTREREIVESFHAATEAWHEDDNPRCDWPIEQMRATPQAAAPVYYEGESCGDGDNFTTFFFPGESPRVHPGDRVRVVKIEGTKR